MYCSNFTHARDTELLHSVDCHWCSCALWWLRARRREPGAAERRRLTPARVTCLSRRDSSLNSTPLMLTITPIGYTAPYDILWLHRSLTVALLLACRHAVFRHACSVYRLASYHWHQRGRGVAATATHASATSQACVRPTCCVPHRAPRQTPLHGCVLPASHAAWRGRAAARGRLSASAHWRLPRPSASGRTSTCAPRLVAYGSLLSTAVACVPPPACRRLRATACWPPPACRRRTPLPTRSPYRSP